MIRTYKYRLYPNKAQFGQLDYLLWQGRQEYNAALEQRITAYKETGKGVTYPTQWAHFRDARNANPDGWGQLNATSMQQLLRRLDKGFKAFFRRLKQGETPGFPRFKGRHRFNSLEYRHGDGCKLRFDDSGRALFYVQNVGEVKVKYHRAVPEEAAVKHVIIKQRNRKWYVCLQVEQPDPVIEPPNGAAVGIDMGLHSLLALSNGNMVENPRWLRQDLAKLRRAQRTLSRRKKGSKRRRKAAQRVASLHERIANRRRDYWHKVTYKLTQQNSLIAIENLTLKFMTTNHNLALSAHDAGLGEFQQLLAYKAESAGVPIVTVNPAYTSQVCSGCGVIVEKNLSVRIHRCPDCGLILDRDVNAAKNILNLALTKPADESGPARTERSGHNVTESHAVTGCSVRALRSSPI